MHPLAALGSAAIGVAACFFGYRLFKVILAIWGFLLGMALFSDITMRITHERLIAVVAGLIGGIVVAGIAEILYLVGVFLMGVALGVVVTGAASGAMGMAFNPLIALMAGGLAGLMALSFQKAVIIWATSFNGAWMTITGVVMLQGRARGLGDVPAATGRGGLFLAWLALGFAGLVVQYAVTSRGVRHGPPPPQQ